jgi:NADH-quinone oxidoreductase subunit G
MPTIYIDDKAFEAKEGENILQACLGLGIDLPYFCWHPAMGSIGACRQCAVVQYQNEEDTRGRIVMGCMTPVTDGARFSLSGDKAQAFREDIIESLMLNHPHDCPVCAEGGECHLQDMTVMVGHRDREYRGRKNTHRNQYLGPLIHHEMNRCITCYRCTRYYRDYAGGTDLAAMASHDHTYFGRHEEGILESEFAGNLVEVCPTGVFTDKSLVQEYTRKWDLQSAPSVCTGCSVGCNIVPGERYGKLKRIHNRFNSEVNGYFLCDRGRFGGSFVNSEERIPAAGKRDTEGRFNPVETSDAIDNVAAMLEQGNVVGIGSPRASIEANFALRELVGASNYNAGHGDIDSHLVEHALSIQTCGEVSTPSIRTMEGADAVLILGEDVTNTAPRIALALRQAVRNKAYELAAELRLETWQDAAIRNLAQDQRSPLFIAAVAETRLDDVATATCQLAPTMIAGFGCAIADLIAGKQPSTLSDELHSLATEVAQALTDAQRPLVVSGTGCGSVAVLDAAARINAALVTRNSPVQLSLSVPECNSIGASLLQDTNAPTLEELAQRSAQGDIDTLLIVENDLYRRADAATIEQLLTGAKQVVVMDTLDQASCNAADIVLPSASFAESEGTLISQEGRAQRYYPVFQPSGQTQASWSWLTQIAQAAGRPTIGDWKHFDDVTSACESSVPGLQGICDAAPPADYRSRGGKIPRQPHRYSGRTAMRANVSVHEPKQTVDGETPLAYTMEGHSGEQPGALLAHVWSPGWNSNQSLHKFQSEVGGSLRGGTAGVCIFEPGDKALELNNSEPDTAVETTADTTRDTSKGPDGQHELVAMYRIFGSDELSARSPAIAELCRPATLELTSEDAAKLGLREGDGVSVNGPQGQTDLELAINDSLAGGCAGFSCGISGTAALAAGQRVSLSRAENWQRAPELIGTDRGSAS